MKPRGWSNLAALGHQELTRWGDRCHSLGIPTAGPLARIIEEGAVGAAIRPGGTHGDPTLAALIRDEPVYNTDRAVRDLGDENAELRGLIEEHYIRGEAVEERRMWTAQNWVGSWLMFEGKVPEKDGRTTLHFWAGTG